DAEVPFFLSVDTNGLFAGVRSGGVSRVLRFDLSTTTANTWHHAAASLNASTRVLTLYLDGVQVSQTTLGATSTTGNSAPVDIGRSATDGNFWLGKIDDVRVWNVVRSSSQIQSSYRTEFSTAPTGL